MSERKTVTISLHNLEAIFEKCTALPHSEKRMLLARIRAHDESPPAKRVKAPFLSLYCVDSNIVTSFPVPSTPVHVFKMITTFDDALPYEIKGETEISHLVVVTISVDAAINLFYLLLAQRGLKIRFLEFLILTGVDRDGTLYTPPTMKEFEKKLEGTALFDWSQSSPSIKISRVLDSIDQELLRHVNYVAESGSLRMVRGLDDHNRMTSVVPSVSYEFPHFLDQNQVFKQLTDSENRNSTSSRSPPQSPLRSPPNSPLPSLPKVMPVERVLDFGEAKPCSIEMQRAIDACISKDPKLRDRGLTDVDNNNRIGPTHRTPAVGDVYRSRLMSPLRRMPIDSGFNQVKKEYTHFVADGFQGDARICATDERNWMSPPRVMPIERVAVTEEVKPCTIEPLDRAIDAIKRINRDPRLRGFDDIDNNNRMGPKPRPPATDDVYRSRSPVRRIPVDFEFYQVKEEHSRSVTDGSHEDSKLRGTDRRDWMRPQPSSPVEFRYNDCGHISRWDSGDRATNDYRHYPTDPRSVAPPASARFAKKMIW